MQTNTTKETNARACQGTDGHIPAKSSPNNRAVMTELNMPVHTRIHAHMLLPYYNSLACDIQSSFIKPLAYYSRRWYSLVGSTL